MTSEIKQQLKTDIKESMKARDKVRTGTVRMLLAAVVEEETSAGGHEVTEESFVPIVAREIKKRRESADIYRENGRDELADAELAEVAVLEDYQPTQLDDAEVDELVSAAIAEVEADTGDKASMKQMGQVMKTATAKAAGKVDGKRLSGAVKQALAGSAR